MAHFFAATDTSRANSRDKRAELEASDLRDTGAIEEDAAALFLLFEDREDAELSKTEAIEGKARYTTGPVQTWLKVAKNRYGAQGWYLKLQHHKTETRFETI